MTSSAIPGSVGVAPVGLSRGQTRPEG
jgi:hypothetical protein